MRTALQVAFHNLDVSEALRGLIEEKAAWLERYHDRIIGCRVVVEAPHRRHRQGNPYQVRIDLALPGTTLVVTREATEGLEPAIRDAFDAVRRQVEDFARRRREDARGHRPASADTSAAPTGSE
jgi:ribosomal subunit interface protein